MKKLLLAVSILMVVGSAVCAETTTVDVQSTSSISSAPPTGQPAANKSTSPSPRCTASAQEITSQAGPGGVSRDDLEKGYRRQIGQLEKVRTRIGRSNPSYGWVCGRISAIRQKLADHEKRISFLEKNPLGGKIGQQKVRSWMTDNGYKTSGQLQRQFDSRYVRQDPLTSNSTRFAPAKSAGSTSLKGENEMLPWIILGILAVALVVGATVWITITVIHNRRVLPSYLDGTRRAETLPNIPADAYQEGSHTVYSSNGVFSRKWHTN